MTSSELHYICLPRYEKWDVLQSVGMNLLANLLFSVIRTFFHYHDELMNLLELILWIIIHHYCNTYPSPLKKRTKSESLSLLTLHFKQGRACSHSLIALKITRRLASIVLVRANEI